MRRDFSPTNKRLKSSLSDVPIKMISAVSLDDGPKWEKLYQQLASGGPR